MLPGTARRKEIVNFTDARSKVLYMEITLYKVDACIIIEGWDECAKEHNLEAVDVIKFPAQLSHRKYFLIEYVRNKESGSDPSQ